MLCIDLNQANPGMKLTMPVYHPRVPDQVLLLAGYCLDRVTIQRLIELTVYSVWIRYPGMEQISPYLSTQLHCSQATIVQEVANTFNDLQHCSNAKLPYAIYCLSIRNLVEQLNADQHTGNLSWRPCRFGL